MVASGIAMMLLLGFAALACRSTDPQSPPPNSPLPKVDNVDPGEPRPPPSPLAKDGG